MNYETYDLSLVQDLFDLMLSRLKAIDTNDNDKMKELEIEIENKKSELVKLKEELNGLIVFIDAGLILIDDIKGTYGKIESS